MSPYTLVPVTPSPVLLGESPIWDYRSQKLIFIDCFGESINTFDPNTGEVVGKHVEGAWGLAPVGGMPSWHCLAIPFASSPSKFLIQSSNGDLAQFNWDLQISEGIRKEPRQNTKENRIRFYSDGKCDAKGRFWTGFNQLKEMEDFSLENIAEDEGQVVTYIKSGESVSKSTAVSGFDIPNGLAWNVANDKLFWVDSLKRIISLFDFDLENGTLGKRSVFFEYGKYKELDGSLPDGMVVDLNGHLWVASWNGKSIIKIDGGTGKLVEKVEIPVSNVTSVCFGGSNYESLYVTTASVGLDRSPIQGESGAGKLFQIRNEKDNTFKGFQHYFFQF